MRVKELFTNKSLERIVKNLEWLDLLLITLIIPLILYLFFLLPKDISSYLVLSSEVFYPWAVFTSAFIHFGMGHLASNIGYFVVFGLTGYWLLFRTGKRKLFLLLLGVFIFVVPPISSSLSVGLTFLKSTKGFSSVVNALLGLIPVALAYYWRENDLGKSFENLCFSFLLIGVSIIPLKYLDNPLMGISIFTVMVSLGFLLLYRELKRVRPSAPRVTAGAVYCSFVSFMVYFVGLHFSIPGPGNIVSSSGHPTNVLSHYIGFLLGILLSYIAIKIKDR